MALQFNQSLYIKDNEVAFEKLFFDYEQQNQIRDKLTENAAAEFTIKEFTSQYASLLLQYNSQYLELRNNKEKLTETLTLVESQYYRRGEAFHYITPEATESTLVTTLNQALSLEGEPCIKLYIYVDEHFAFKTRAHNKGSNPVINLDIDIDLQRDLDHDDLNSTDKSDYENDDDKIFYTKIGKTEILIDKVLQNLLVQDELEDDILQSDGEDVFSTNSLGRLSSLNPDYRNLIQTKGKLSLTFRAELTDEWYPRVQKVKQQYLKETFEQIQQLRQIVDQKKSIILQAIEVLFYMQFDDDQGLVLDQLQMMLESSFDNMSASASNNILSHHPSMNAYQSNQSPNYEQQQAKPQPQQQQIASQKQSNYHQQSREPDLMSQRSFKQSDFARKSTTRGEVEEALASQRSSNRESRDQKKLIKQKNQQEIFSLEHLEVKPEKQRMCGCDSMCCIF
ncbi:UNKNOWN [Stylonychia lemnae]|uniref:Uncharacterized protein n=1 Tax=Stylonychia lemnae TaxID=5949 RepID=A0A078A8N5_STYLE|nr:UNKNOWN [Stylonychia lemnae]|eukprot:CDW77156.1 UNKNOWN [Stylonychia lemnae]